jgi:hypothetical protein
MAYADDLKGLRYTCWPAAHHRSGQTTLKMALDRQRDKKVTMISNPNGSASGSQNEPDRPANNQTSLCGVTHLPNLKRAKHLGLIITDGCSHDSQVSQLKRTGRLSSLGKCPKEPQAAYRDQIRVIDSFIRPCIYAMVWAPSGRNETIKQTTCWKKTQAGMRRPRHIHWTPENMCRR